MHDISLFFFTMFIIGLTVYGILTNTCTEEERDEMLNSDEMFP